MLTGKHIVLCFDIAFFAVLSTKDVLADQGLSQSILFSNGSYSFVDGIHKDSAVAWATYSNEINKTGWAFLEVYTSKRFSTDEQAYAAGLVEGHLTRDLINDHFFNTYKNYCKTMTTYCKNLLSYIEGNTEFVKEQVAFYPDATYVQQVKAFYHQYAGLKDGYNNQIKGPRIEIDLGLFLLQIAGDLEDLEPVLGKEDYQYQPGNGHCSALVKMLPNFEDIYIAQDTWNGYNSMLRMLKKYHFEYYTNSSRKELVPGQTMTFSSYPGILMSGDDFYVINTGLVTLETTIGNGNSDLYKYQGKTDSTLEGIRTMLANRLSTYSEDWAFWFSSLNSGTYNNQWLILDYKQFHKGQGVDEGLLLLLEQIPGVIEYEDMTHLLYQQTYWPSYNIPYFDNIFNLSGGNENVKRYGDWFLYSGSPRAKIFKRDHVKITDINSMIKVMRYNDYQHDPLAKCNCTPPYSAENAISARSDLNPANGSYPFAALGHRLHGGTDMKMTSYDLAKTLDFVAVSSPTFDNVPPFQWSKSDWSNTPHRGQPDLWNFKPIQTKWNGNS